MAPGALVSLGSVGHIVNFNELCKKKIFLSVFLFLTSKYYMVIMNKCDSTKFVKFMVSGVRALF